jgi:hypothetical protein
MRCHICDRPLDEPKFVEEVGNYDPCDTCMTVIEDTLAGYENLPDAEEDGIVGVDPLWDELYPTVATPPS